MELSPTKYQILEALLLHIRPTKAADVAKETGKNVKAVQMHLINLTRSGHVTSPQKGNYIINEQGKKALCLPEITKEKAHAIMAKTTREKAFHFYDSIEKPLNISSHDLNEFCGLIPKINLRSIEFHLCRGDFEAWFKGLGDIELAKKTAFLRERKINGEEFRALFREIVENRCIELSKIIE